jgi:hypothetical protein
MELLSREIRRRERKWIFGRFLRRLEVDLLKGCNNFFPLVTGKEERSVFGFDDTL